MKHNHDSHHLDTAPEVVEVSVKNAHDGSDYASLEACFCKLRGVTAAHLDRTRGVAHLGYDLAVTTPETVQEQLRQRGYKCDCKGCAGSKSHAGHPCVGASDQATIGHAAHGELVGHDEHAGHGAACSS